MPITGPAWRRRRDAAGGRRDGPGSSAGTAAARAFDLLAVVAALALVGLGLANLYLIGAAGAGRRGRAMIAGGGRARPRGVLAGPRPATSASWAGPPTARPSLLLVGVLAVGLSANGATRWIAIGSVHLPALRAGQARAAAGPRRRPRLEPAGVAALRRWPCCSRSCRSGSPCSSRTSAPRRCSPSSPGPCWSSGACPRGSCCRWPPRRRSRRRW